MQAPAAALCLFRYQQWQAYVGAPTPGVSRAAWVAAVFGCCVSNLAFSRLVGDLTGAGRLIKCFKHSKLKQMLAAEGGPLCMPVQSFSVCCHFHAAQCQAAVVLSFESWITNRILFFGSGKKLDNLLFKYISPAPKAQNNDHLPCNHD